MPTSGAMPINRELTFGQKLVGMDFKPENNIQAEMIKAGFASLIDHMHELRSRDHVHTEVARMLSLAITEAQTAQMWAVKAVTWKY